jgi:flagellar protein FlbD
VILVTRLDGTPVIVNSDQIAWIEHNPDTVVVLNNGERLIVRESPEMLVERVRDFKRAVATVPPSLERPTLKIAEGAGSEPC